MANKEQRGNREKRKPKKEKPKPAAHISSFSSASAKTAAGKNSLGVERFHAAILIDMPKKTTPGKSATARACRQSHGDESRHRGGQARSDRRSPPKSCAAVCPKCVTCYGVASKVVILES